MENQLLFILVLGVVVSSVLSVSQNKEGNPKEKPRPVHAQILKQINKLNSDGSYTFGYEADDGSFKVETRSKEGVVKGKYGFIDPSGHLKTVEYSAGRQAPSPDHESRESRLTSATETEPVTVKKETRETPASDEGSSGENSSGGGSTESGSAEDEPAFNSFNAQVEPKDGEQESELTKRQGQLGGLNTVGNDAAIRAQYARQGQIFQGNPQAYIPTTQLPGGQFRGQFIDPRGQLGFDGQQYYPGQGRQPQYISGGVSQSQFPGGGFSVGGPGQSHYVGRQYPQQFSGGSPQYGGVHPPTTHFVPLSPSNQVSQENEGFISGPPPTYFGSPGGPQSQQFDYNNGVSPQEFGRSTQAFQSPYQQQQFPSGGIGTQQFGRPEFNRYATSGGRPSYSRGLNDNVQQQYVPNADLDGFSEDNDQDGFVDSFPGNGIVGNKAEAADEKTPAVKTPTGQKVESPYSPQVLGPQQVLQGQGRTNLGQLSPYDEQQIYAQPGIPRPQNPYASYPGQVNQFAIQGQRPQFQSYPGQQQFSPQPSLFGGPQYISNGQVVPFVPGRDQYNNINGVVPYQGAQGQAFGQLPIQGRQPYVQGQLGPGTLNSQPQFVNNVQGGGAGAQFPFDYVGGVGPSGFPIGGPQTQYLQQQQLQGGPSAGPTTAQLSPTPGAVQVVTADSKKLDN